MWKVLFLLFCAPCFAGDGWFCEEESAERRGNSFYVCGVGHGETQEDARAAALTSARAEFASLCAASDDCNHHRVRLEPGRTTCEGTQCTRLLVYTIESQKDAVRIQVGMTKEAVLDQFGEPEKTGHPSDGTLCFRYKGQMCDGEYCFVYFRGNQVFKSYDFKDLYAKD